MSYEVLALKWRPKTFSEFIAQEAAQTTLTNALKNNRLHPVCLFTGPRGTGKTSMARILAKTLRCENKKDILSPCNSCEECLAIQTGKSLDVIEIDGASNNGVEAVRELRDTLSYMPSSGSKKIYIIDEVHMLSTSAFNALLKTLEEPPSHVLFVMATTEAQKIPLTVISRCQQFHFHLIPSRLIRNQLQKISKAEKISIDDKSLWLITNEATGSLRDAQSLLDQMATFCERDITYEKVIENLGLSDPQVLLKTLKALCERDEKQMVCIIDEQHRKAVEPKLFLQNIIEGLRDLLILKKNPKNRPPLVNRSEQEIDEMKSFSCQISAEDLHFLFDLALKGERDQALCHDSQLALDVLLLKLSQSPRLESLIPLNPFLEKNPFAPSSESFNKSVSSETDSLSDSRSSSPVESKFKDNGQSSSTIIEDGEKSWLDFIQFLKSKNSILAGMAANLSLKKVSEACFIFYAPSAQFVKEKITQPENFQFLIEQLNLFFKSDKKFSIQFQGFDRINQSVATPESLKQQQEQEDLLNQAHLDPVIQKLNQVFEGHIGAIKRLDSD